MLGSPLQRAIKRGMEEGGDLGKEVSALRDYSIKAKRDAKAICQALEELPYRDATNTGICSRLSALVGLFQDVESADVPAFGVLYEQGLPLLIAHFDARIEDADEERSDDLLLILKILAMFGSHEGAERVIRAARLPFRPDRYMWSVILRGFSAGHPECDFVLRGLSDPLPPDFIGMALLDAANDLAREGDVQAHPFDSKEGVERLRAWLTDRNPEHFSYATSASAALPFINQPELAKLFSLALEHVDPRVQLESAWAAAKLGRDGGLKVLARFCCDVNHSATARRYLAELDREDVVPEEALGADFQAKAEFANWLSHPNELGQPPDEIEIVDHRVLRWPPDREETPVWLLKYRLCDKTGLAEDDVECGMVGTITWCFFSMNLRERHPEDAYAVHCVWEMEHEELISTIEVESTDEYDSLKSQWTGPAIRNCRLLQVMEISHKLKYPQRLVGVASAELDDRQGWVVLDGPRSIWYDKSSMPAEEDENTVLMVHVGRQLLGFTNEPDRKNYLNRSTFSPEPEQIVAAYERLVAEAEAGDAIRRKELLTAGHGPLSEHFEKYVDARASVSGQLRHDVIVEAYQMLLAIAKKDREIERGDLCDSFSPLGENFELYVEALVNTERCSEVESAIALFDPHWKHNSGYGLLGKAAFQAGLFDLAEPYLVKLRESYHDWARSEEMALLADIWTRRGWREEAEKLMIESMMRLVADRREASASDKKLHEEWFQNKRSSYLRLFPDRGEAALAEHGIPPTTMT